MGEPRLSPEGEQLCHVYSTPQVFAYVFHDQPEKASRAEEIAYSLDMQPFLKYMDPEPGLMEVLAELKQHYKVAMATNRGRSVPALLMYFGLENTFDYISTILDVTHPKPAPDLLLHCLQHAQTMPEEAIYVGDMENDRIASMAAGIPFIAKGNNLLHHWTIQRLTELPSFLATLFRGEENR
jgi:HAD superfamily hydrolase (TIGR01509 family)